MAFEAAEGGRGLWSPQLWASNRERARPDYRRPLRRWLLGIVGGPGVRKPAKYVCALEFFQAYGVPGGYDREYRFAGSGGRRSRQDGWESGQGLTLHKGVILVVPTIYLNTSLCNPEESKAHSLLVHTHLFNSAHSLLASHSFKHSGCIFQGSLSTNQVT